MPLLAVETPPNPWFSWRYVTDNSESILAALREHVLLTVEAVAVAVLVAVPLALVARRWRRLSAPILAVAGVLYTIPSLALFAFLAPYTGIRSRTVLIGLVLYALLILVRNMLTGLQEVPDDVREAARGMGYGRVRLLLRVDLPLALPTIMAGVRVATVSTVALVTVGVVVGYGGLGRLIIGGFQNSFYRAEIVTGSALCVLLALAADLLLAGLTRVLMPWTWRARGGRARTA